jgi:predicted RND superfamily exporter protein
MEKRLAPIFKAVIRRRWLIVAFYALALVPAVFFSLRVTQDNSIDRLIVQNDPDSIAARAFTKMFGNGEYVVLVAEAPDPYAPLALKRLIELEDKLAKIPKVEPGSTLYVYRQKFKRFSATPEEAAAFKKFALVGTTMFRKQGVVSETHISLPLILDVGTTAERRGAVNAIDEVLKPYEQSPAPLTALRKVGQPYVNAYLDIDTQRTGARSFAIFTLFVIVLVMTLYRSVRTLIAFLLSLGTSVAFTTGYVGLTGGVFTIVSTVVPMTVLITCTATLVYLHSRFVECPPDRDHDEHQIFALCNKFLACTASIVATAIGFAALAVSKIRPIREMGIWVAVGLVCTWVVVFTLFPALQKILSTPTEKTRKAAGTWLQSATGWLPMWSYRFRWVLVPMSLVMCGLGAVAVFGLPGYVAPMELQTNAVEYINHNTSLYKDTKLLEQKIGGLAVTQVWLRGKKLGAVTDIPVIRGLHYFERELEKDPAIGSVVGPVSILRTLRYVGGQGDQLPEDEDALESAVAQLEKLVAQKQPMLTRFVEPKTMQNTRLALITPTVDYKGFQKLDGVIRAHWKDAQKRHPALADFTIDNVGQAALAAKISFHLVPTLVESFGLTVVIILATFLLVFRNGAARLMAMIPSLFAILVMFGFMRIFGMSLNVATIVIATTVLGTSENDQIHFFFHFLEKRTGGTTEDGLRYTLQVAGRAIFFATLINAGGFMAFALADLPPIRQFGILSALAFILSMIADFTALPASLWIVFRERPESLKPGAAAAGRPGESVPGSAGQVQH